MINKILYGISIWGFVSAIIMLILIQLNFITFGSASIGLTIYLIAGLLILLSIAVFFIARNGILEKNEQDQ